MPHAWNLEMIYCDAILVKNEIQFFAWRATWVRGQAFRVGAFQSGGSHKQINFVFAPESVEVTGYDHRFFSRSDKVVEFSELQVTMSVFKRQMHQKT